LKKTLYISLDILYIGERMSQTQVKKIRIGPKEKAILDFLSKHPEGVWKTDLINHFSWASEYNAIMIKRLHNMAKKGLIIIRYELNPESGRSKQRVYLKR